MFDVKKIKCKKKVDRISLVVCNDTDYLTGNGMIQFYLQHFMLK